MVKPSSVLIKGSSGGEAAVDKALDEVRRIAQARRGLLDGAIELQDVALTTTAFARIAHNLKRRPKGYVVARTKSAPGAAFVLYDDNDNRTDADRFLYLRTVGANVTVDLVVY